MCFFNIKWKVKNNIVNQSVVMVVVVVLVMCWQPKSVIQEGLLASVLSPKRRWKKQFLAFLPGCQTNTTLILAEQDLRYQEFIHPHTH
jgi:hypothetical protein